ncbi:Kynurenine/alpha-aminoadipate aminotransferase [Emiliania huxleyi CCMP1516]|uniref:Aminotransferase class I/classII large domain-containing protein n=2 Tax=Emiliania huxleyi TaxID=2903 RepID=A0A0D3IT45_EMIH1|nr:Kynurenine/alpha-aminoadipate aminotransferase [Emiliania huxleyi CCMP1516]EOD14430.1 Kynurenine/alpha-aminoadipate aminotransferase [Emiliania huxleyi CCMP1516]|eukprot:XP_005766859.1 Kynurenine/alpha-aminoadipate aminotransferase [Emiliania huxleyi CCMP1516]
MMRTFCAGVVAGVSLSWLYPRLLRQLSFVTRLVRVRVSSRAAPSFSIERCLSRVARAKRPALLRELLPLLKLDGMVPMAGGTPHRTTFPVRAYQLELADGGVVRIDEPQLAQQYMHDVTPGVGTVGYLPLLEWALFTIPSFHNPTTASASLAALRADPLAAEDAGAALPGTERAGLPPSFLSVDTDGRVVRCDTFSKWVSPGLRCGFVTAPRPLIVKLAQGAGPSLGVSSPVQVFLVEMLRRWGPAGLHRHAAYRRRCAVALTAAAEHLSGLARWEAPRGGTLLGAGLCHSMFLWLELLGVRSSADLLDEMTRERVCVVPGADYSSRGHEAPR